jgi:hypothetical protein
MTDQIQFIETNLGKLALKLATAKLTKRGVPLSSIVVASVEDFLSQVSSITVPSTLADKTAAAALRLAEAKAAFDSTLQSFFDDFVADAPQEDLEDSGRADSSQSHPSSARILVA